MSPELEQLVMKALYAGYKYFLCANRLIDDLEEPQPHEPNPHSKLLDEHFTAWRHYTQLAVRLHQQEQTNDDQLPT